MASDAPDQELVRAMLEALRADPDMISLVGAAIYERVPDAGVLSEYVSVGPTDGVPDDFDCIAGEEITVQLDAWSTNDSEALSSAKVRKIRNAMRRCLHDRELALESNALVTLQLTLWRIVRETDGITNHAVLQFTATVETP